MKVKIEFNNRNESVLDFLKKIHDNSKKWKHNQRKFIIDELNKDLTTPLSVLEQDRIPFIDACKVWKDKKNLTLANIKSANEYLALFISISKNQYHIYIKSDLTKENSINEIHLVIRPVINLFLITGNRGAVGKSLTSKLILSCLQEIEYKNKRGEESNPVTWILDLNPTNQHIKRQFTLEKTIKNKELLNDINLVLAKIKFQQNIFVGSVFVNKPQAERIKKESTTSNDIYRNELQDCHFINRFSKSYLYEPNIFLSHNNPEGFGILYPIIGLVMEFLKNFEVFHKGIVDENLSLPKNIVIDSQIKLGNVLAHFLPLNDYQLMSESVKYNLKIVSLFNEDNKYNENLEFYRFKPLLDFFPDPETNDFEAGVIKSHFFLKHILHIKQATTSQIYKSIGKTTKKSQKKLKQQLDKLDDINRIINFDPQSRDFDIDKEIKELRQIIDTDPILNGFLLNEDNQENDNSIVEEMIKDLCQSIKDEDKIEKKERYSTMNSNNDLNVDNLLFIDQWDSFYDNLKENYNFTKFFYYNSTKLNNTNLSKICRNIYKHIEMLYYNRFISINMIDELN